MPFSSAQVDWLAKTQQSAIDFEALIAKQDARNALLADVSQDVLGFQEDLMAATSDLKVEWPRDKFLGLIERSNRKMDWNKGDRDNEVDTVHDLTGEYQVDDDAVREMHKLHEKLIDLQTKMETATDADGNPLFTPADITRELWTPLVQADVIPSNAVADKYSQEAQVFNGACEIYQQKLEDYTKSASKHAGAQRLLRIGMDTVSVVGSVAGDAITLGNLDAMSISREDALDLSAGVTAPAGSEEAQAQADNIKRINGLKQKAREAQLQIAGIGIATAVANGGLEVLVRTLDKPADDEKVTYATGITRAVVGALGAAASGAIGVYSANMVASNPDEAFSSAFQTQMNIASKSVTAIVAGSNVALRLGEAGVKFAHGDEKGGTACITDAINSLASAIGASFAAVDVKRGTDADGNMILGDQAKWQQIGLTVQGAILASSSIPAIAKHIYDVCKTPGGKVDMGAVLANIGFPAIASTLAGAMPLISGGTYSVPDDGQIDRGSAEALWQKTQAEYDSFNNDADAAEALAETAGDKVDFADPIPDPAVILAQKKWMAEQENARKEKGMADFKLALQDPAQREAFFNEVSAASDVEMEALNALLDEATTPPQDLDSVEKEQRAMAAMDKLIAEAQACNTKWQALEIVTGIGAAALAAALPGAGLAVAIQKLLIDATTLVRKSVELNKWMDNLALTVGNSSVYGPAIQSRLNSARVQVSLQVLRVLYDSLGVAAESIKLADASGASMGGGLAVGTGLQAGASIARALTEYGYKMHKEAEIEAGWQLYKRALASPGDRKKARTAMKWNSTLSKCVIAYGIVIDGDPIAKEVGRSCGITPEVLADQKNVCPKVVSYFETLYTDDPSVLKRVPIKKDWHPGTPVLTLVSWIRFKAAAQSQATPPLSVSSTATPAIDGQLAGLVKLLGADSDYANKRDMLYPEYDFDNVPPKRETPEYKAFLDDTAAAVKALIAALRSYKPLNADPAEGDDWIGMQTHVDFADVVVSMTAQAQMIEGEVANDLKLLAAAGDMRDALMDALDDASVADDEDEFEDAVQ